MGKIEQVAYLLGKKELKSIENITRHCTLTTSEIKDALDFLYQYSLLERNNNTNTFRLNPKLVELLELEKAYMKKQA
jgi:DNA-binding IclR family transcriptional regulator